MHNKKAYTSLINLNKIHGEEVHLADFIEDVLMDVSISYIQISVGLYN